MKCSPRRAFTLLELTVTLALVAMLLGVAAFNLRGPYRAAQLTAALEQFELFDQQMRNHSQHFDQTAELRIGLGTGDLEAVPTAGHAIRTRHLRLPRGTFIDRFLSAEATLTRGKGIVSFSGNGQSPTYALRFCGIDGASRWLVVIGMTGQTVQMSDEKQLQNLLRNPRPERPDAD